MNRLIPCLACSRHVRIQDASCPFCGNDMAAAQAAAPALPPAMAWRHLGRAAVFAIGSTMAVTACGGEAAEDTGTAGTAGAQDSGTSEPDPVPGAPVYGAVAPPDAGMIEPDPEPGIPEYGAVAPPEPDPVAPLYGVGAFRE